MSDQANDQIKLAYEAYSRMVLQNCVNYIDGDERVDRIWIYTDLGHEAIETTCYFRFDGRFYDYYDLAEADNSRGYDTDGFDDTMDRQVQVALVQALRAGSAIPERIITTYDPIEGRLDAQWDYEGVVTDEHDTYGRARDRWIAGMGGNPVFS